MWAGYWKRSLALSWIYGKIIKKGQTRKGNGERERERKSVEEGERDTQTALEFSHPKQTIYAAKYIFLFALRFLMNFSPSLSVPPPLSDTVAATPTRPAAVSVLAEITKDTWSVYMRQIDVFALVQNNKLSFLCLPLSLSFSLHVRANMSSS